METINGSIKIDRINIAANGFEVPTLILMSPKSRGAVVVAHNYGGSKEEMLGLGLLLVQLWG